MSAMDYLEELEVKTIPKEKIYCVYIYWTQTFTYLWKLNF